MNDHKNLFPCHFYVYKLKTTLTSTGDLKSEDQPERRKKVLGDNEPQNSELNFHPVVSNNLFLRSTLPRRVVNSKK